MGQSIDHTYNCVVPDRKQDEVLKMGQTLVQNHKGSHAEAHRVMADKAYRLLRQVRLDPSGFQLLVRDQATVRNRISERYSRAPIAHDS